MSGVGVDIVEETLDGARPTVPQALLLDEASVRAAVAVSAFRDLGDPAVGALLEGARLVSLRAGELVRGVSVPGPHMELVVEGLVRGVLSSADGRTITIRYGRTGAILGTVSLYASGYRMPGSTQALVPTRLLLLRPDRVDAAMGVYPGVARALLQDLSERVRDYIEQIQLRAFSPVRERVIRHLLHLAAPTPDGSTIVANVSQQELADAAGSVREVVVRVLLQLRDEGLVTTGRGWVVLLDPLRMSSFLPELGQDPGRAWGLAR